MAEEDERLELKFRIYDGTDIGHENYSSSTTIAALKQRLFSLWPPGKVSVPKSVSDMKLIHAGRVLENGKTLAESKVHAGDLPGGVITMHVVVQPPIAKKKSGDGGVPDIPKHLIDKNQGDKEKQGSCSCTIL